MSLPPAILLTGPTASGKTALAFELATRFPCDIVSVDSAQVFWPALHAELARLDPDTAARLKPTDAQRIQRAVEVLRLTGRTLGSFFAAQQAQALPCRLLALALVPGERSVLHRRIEQRFDAMLNAGLVEEVLLLREKYRLDGGLPSMRCVGYRQVWDMLEGNLPRAELRDRGVFATRQFAKRQLTWLKSMDDLRIVDPLAADPMAAVRAAVAAHLEA